MKKMFKWLKGLSEKSKQILFSSSFIDDVMSDKITLHDARRMMEKELQKVIVAKAPKETKGTRFCCWLHGYVTPSIPVINMNGHYIREKQKRQPWILR